MNISLCAQLSKNVAPDFALDMASVEAKINENIQAMEDALKQAVEDESDFAVFGEAFLHGFDSLKFDYKRDIQIASSSASVELAKISALAVKYDIAIAFGYYENAKGVIYSSYLVLDRNGERICNYRRVSEGWRIQEACADYREGKEFISFELDEKEFAIMLCGDFWEDHLLSKIIELDDKVDAFLWPVHCDYKVSFWESTDKADYIKRSEILESPVLFYNNFCEEENTAKGGAYLWYQGKTYAEMPMGKRGVLTFNF